jgi:hypothetical protein
MPDMIFMTCSSGGCGGGGSNDRFKKPVIPAAQ